MYFEKKKKGHFGAYFAKTLGKNFPQKRSNVTFFIYCADTLLHSDKKNVPEKNQSKVHTNARNELIGPSTKVGDKNCWLKGDRN